MAPFSTRRRGDRRFSSGGSLMTNDTAVQINAYSVVPSKLDANRPVPSSRSPDRLWQGIACFCIRIGLQMTPQGLHPGFRRSDVAASGPWLLEAGDQLGQAVDLIVQVRDRGLGLHVHLVVERGREAIL